MLLYTLFGQLPVDFFFAVDCFYSVEFLSAHPGDL